jgi:outer membrane protein TolC
MDLKQCLQTGLQNNYDIRIVRNEQQIATNNLTPGNAGYLPQLDLATGYSGTMNNIEQRNAVTGESTKNSGVDNRNLTAGIDLNWTIFDGFNIQTNYRRLKELKQMGELNTRLVIESFIANLSAEYYNFIQQTIRLNNLRYTVKLSRERVRIAEARYAIGDLARLDLQQAKVDFNADSSMLIKQQEILYTSRTKLNQFMAVKRVEDPLSLADSLILFDATLNRERIWQDALSTNVLLLQAKNGIRLSELELKSIQSQDYPYLRLNAGYDYGLNRYEIGANDRQQTLGFNYGITIGINLFDGLNRRRNKRNVRLQIENRRLETEQMELSVRTDLTNMWMAYRNNMKLTNLERENLLTARDNHAIAIDRYKLGNLSGLELREAQNSLFEAEERLVQAEYNTKLCEISLMQISGNITQYVE